MAQGILAFAEQRDGAFKKTAYESLAAARTLKETLGGDVTAVVVGHGVGDIAKTLAAHGADKIVCFDAEPLTLYSTEGYGWCLEQAVASADPAAIVVPASTMGRDLGGQVAARLGCGLISDCTQIEAKDGAIRGLRPVYAGKALAWVKVNSNRAVLGVRPNTFAGTESSPGATGDVTSMSFDFGAGDIRSKVVEVKAPQAQELDVAEADIVVAGGRAVGGPEGFAPLEELAKVLGAAVGASRAVVDAGWRDHGAQVGQTGKVVAPNLYFACGISGAIQHLAGMRTSKVIVAINKDAEAPIFKVADYGIVGDMFEVVPALTEQLRNG